MIQTRRLTIIPSDGTVVTDEGSMLNLDLSSCNIPDDIHALQWNNPPWSNSTIRAQISALPYGQGNGWIEFASPDPNESIDTLPQWAIDCYFVYSSSRPVDE